MFIVNNCRLICCKEHLINNKMISLFTSQGVPCPSGVCNKLEIKTEEKTCESSRRNHPIAMIMMMMIMMMMMRMMMMMNDYDDDDDDDEEEDDDDDDDEDDDERL